VKPSYGVSQKRHAAGRAEEYILIAAPKGEGETEDAPWIDGNTKVLEGAKSFHDGLANTEAMAAAGSGLAKWARNLRLGGFDDWYLPSRDELEMLYRAFKPTKEENFCASGDNPSSVPVTWAYSRDVPPQTGADVFQKGGVETFEDTWYWSSTQYAGDESYAWYQSFDTATRTTTHKDYELRARAVRRLPLAI
jgi:hypothetical protein